MYQIDYTYLRPKKAAALKALHEAPMKLRNDLQVWSGENATVLPVRKNDEYGWTGLGGVLDHQNQYVALSATLPFVDIGYSAPNRVYRDKKVVYCGYLIHHWGHFLMEGISRLWYFLENDPTIDQYVFLLDENEQREIRGNYREFLELLGIWSKLEFVNTPTTYREVLVPEISYGKLKYYSASHLSVFDTVAKNIHTQPDWKAYPKIYLSRSQLKKEAQYEFGHEVLDDFFAANGYQVLYPEQVSLSQMIFWIHNAQVVAAASGSAPHNMLFSQQGQHLEILERSVPNNDYQVNINHMKQLHVTYIDANLSLYTVAACGPFLVGYTPLLEQFAKDRHYSPPQDKYLPEIYFDRCFPLYMKAYFDLNQYRWFIEESMIPEMDYRIEAYQEAADFFKDYLAGRKPFLWYHYLMPHYWKQFIKRLIGR